MVWLNPFAHRCFVHITCPEHLPVWGMGQNCARESANNLLLSMIMMQSQTPVLVLFNSLANILSETPLAEEQWVN